MCLIGSRVARRACCGMSMVELVMILLLLGILTISALAKFDSNSLLAGSFATEVRTALRFAHKFASVSGCDVEVTVSAASSNYSLMLRSDATGAAQNCIGASGSFTRPLNNPATGSAYAGAGPNGSVSGNLSVVFTASGAPSSAASVTVAGNMINIEAGTGLVN